MPGLQAGGFIPPLSNFKIPVKLTFISFTPIKLPMDPQAGGGAATQTFPFEYFAKISEISHPATALYDAVSPPMVTHRGEKTKFLSKTSGRNKCNIKIYLLNIIVLILFFLFFSRYNFSTFLQEKAVDSDQGMAGIKGDMVSTLVRAGHGVHSVRLYTTLSQRAIYCRTITYFYHGTSIISDIYCLIYVFKVFLFVYALSERIIWRIVMVIINFRKYLCSNSYQLYVREESVHRWVSTGLYILRR